MYQLSLFEQKIVSELHTRLPYKLHLVTPEIMRDLHDAPRAGGMCQHRGRKVYWNPLAMPKHATAILFHEVAHATMPYVGRPIARGEYEYDLEEVIAEATSRRLMRHFGLSTPETDKTSATYIAQYLVYPRAVTPEDELATYLYDETTKAFEYILENWLPELNMELGKKVA